MKAAPKVPVGIRQRKAMGGVRTFVRPLRGSNQGYLSRYVAVFAGAQNLKEVIPELIHMMPVPCTPHPAGA